MQEVKSGSKQTHMQHCPSWAPLGSCLHAVRTLTPALSPVSHQQRGASREAQWEQPTPPWHLLTSWRLSLPQGQG